jgi:hypothetical protein
MRVLIRGAIVAGIVLAGAAGNPAVPEWPKFGDADAVLFESGKVVTGKIDRAKTTEEVLCIHDGTKLRSFDRTKAVGISVANAAARADIEKRWRSAEPTAKAWFALGTRCKEQKLGVEAVRCFEFVLALDPDHTEAHRALGHAQLDGTWLGRAEVRKKIAEGYVNDKGKLVKKGGEGESGGKTEVKKETNKPEKVRRLLDEPKRASAELARFERERQRRGQDAEEFRKQMEKEFAGVPWTDRYEIKTTHYLLVCNSTKEVANRYAQTMERLYTLLERKFPPERRGLKGRSVVNIYRNGDDFRDQTGMFYGVGGFYRPDNGQLCAYHGTFGLTATTFNVLAHEGTHQFQGKVLASFANTPMWLIEGLAVYFGDGARIDPDGKIVSERIPRDRLIHIQEKIRQDKYERLSKLVTLGRGGFTGSHYADSWALVHFLVNSGPKGQKLFSAYWNIANRSKIEYKHFEQLAIEHSGSVEALEQAYIKHVMALRPDPAGEIRGEYYFSREFFFELRKLGPEWRFYEDEKPSFLVGQLLPNTTAEVEVYYRNNDERAQAGEDYVKKYVTWYKDRILPVRYSNIKAKAVKIHGADAFRFAYEDGGTGAIGATGEITAADLMEELLRRREGQDLEKKPGKPRRYVELLMVGFDGNFSVKASAEKEEFEKFQKAFDLLPEYFEPIHQRRW